MWGLGFVPTFRGTRLVPTSLLIESVHICAVSRQAAGLREGLAAGGADVGAVAGMGALVSRQVTGLREGHAAGGAYVGAFAGMGAHVLRQVAGVRASLAAYGALEDELAPRPALSPLARPSRTSTRSFARVIFLPPLASGHRQSSRLLRLLGSGNLQFWSKLEKKTARCPFAEILVAKNPARGS